MIRLAPLLMLALFEAILGINSSYAGSQQACLRYIHAAPSVDNIRKKALSRFQETKTEKDRCDFTKKTKLYFEHLRKMANICHEHEPQLAEQLLADVKRGLKEIDLTGSECGPKSKSRIMAEERCKRSRTETDRYAAIFQESLKALENDKTLQAKCKFLDSSEKYFISVGNMKKLCDPIYKSDDLRKITGVQTLIKSARAKKAQLCK